MGRILGIDLGTRRVGLALSDPRRIFGSPLTTIPFVSEKSLVEKIQALCTQNDVELVVLGMPYEADGSEGHGCERVRRFASKLCAVGLPTAFQDETLTSRDAQSSLRQVGKIPRQAKEAVDMIAASLILRDYLAQQTNG